MAFEAEYILYDGISSERFGLHLYNENGGLDTTSGPSFSILRAPLQGGLKYVSLGKEDIDPIRVELKFFSKEPLDSTLQGAIHKWLIGKPDYRELHILQPDMNTLRIGCIFHELEFIQNGNETVGVFVAGEGDSCYFRGNDVETLFYGSKGVFSIMNLSDTNEYVSPVIEFTMPAAGGNLSIVNTSNGNEEFLFEDLSGDEKITVDNQTKIIRSSLTYRRLGNFNKSWIRLVPGKNRFTFTCSGGEVIGKIISPVYKVAAQ